MACPSLVVFGSQTTWPSPEYLSQLRATLLLEPSLHPFLTAIKDLHSVWQKLVQWDPRLEAVPGKESLANISHWLDHGDFPTTSRRFPNVLSTPLTTIIHIVQYLRYIEENKAISHSQILECASKGGVQGFCTGILTALAVALSKDEADVITLGGIALRLAVGIGAYVDLDGAYSNPPNETCCYAIRWRAELGKDKVLEILNAYPDAYVSVITDSTSVTITTTTSTSASLCHELSSHGITVKPISLQGRFHSSALNEAAETLSKLCDATPELQFPDASQLRVPVRSNVDFQTITGGSLHRLTIDSILTQLCDWHLTVSAATAQLMQTPHTSILQVGMVDCIPTAITRERGLQITKVGTSRLLSASLSGSGSQLSSGNVTPMVLAPEDARYPEHAIAVVGMACKFPGAESPSEFWDLLSAGTSTLSQLPAERFSVEGLRRSSEDKLRFWGNFISDVDSFDHAFFKRSSREAASMDPQQRLLLQIAYEAMESCGYFGSFGNSSLPSDDIGCYLGVGATDYSDNVASHAPTAYSALGTLRAFLSGKISHFFGWTGPSITFDTACSSSAVAIHAACKAIETGECSQALAGGVSLFTSPNMYQNLAAASFLSPTGATKPFDAKADGYCRGEGVGLVVLKKLSDAIAEGDNVLSVIAGSAVNQNHNSTSITVPHSESQVKLYRKANARAAVRASEVSYVEAHGTGTPVGDPIEFESIRKVYGGAQRTNPVHVSSVKGNIGHLEGASGVAALIKVTLMLQHKKIPVQANFTTLTPKIAPLEPDHMIIPTSKDNDWKANFKVACINNYGASGNNAAMIVCQPPPRRQAGTNHYVSPKHPIFMSANSTASLSVFCKALNRYINSFDSGNPETLLASIAYHLASKQNRSLRHCLTSTVSSLSEFKDLLSSGVAGSSPSHFTAPSSERPVVLAFGGQINDFVGLDQTFCDSSILFRSHLDHCDSILRARGLDSLYPQIFGTSPVDNIVNLHCQLFSLQYACAQSWIDSGLNVAAVVGHSFGQLTALCVCGSLSLEDALKLVSGRASLMQRHWHSERGSMLSVQANLETVLDLVSAVEKPGSDNSIEIACYNGPSSHVLVGTEASIKEVETTLAGRPIKSKKLNVTHGFHSRFCEPLLPALTKLADELRFKDPTISLETCSDHSSWKKPEPRLIAEHTRTPVYFGKAIERLSRRLGQCTWLEAGSGSSITGLIRKALPQSSDKDLFQATQLTPSHLSDATVNLWKAGHRVQFWPYHREQSHEYTPLMLPPYQFEKHSHWLEWIDTASEPTPPSPTVVKMEEEPELLSFIGYSDRNQREAEFAVDPRSETFKHYVSGHAVLSQALCPASLYVELVAEAATTLVPSSQPPSLVPCVDHLDIKSPLGLNDRAVSISLKKREGSSRPSWNFTLSSRPRNMKAGDTSGSQQHASGRISFDSTQLAESDDFARYERIIGHNRYAQVMADPEAEALQGALIYNVFGKFVSYKDYYRGVKNVFAKDREVAGIVTLPTSSGISHSTISQPVALDNFLQVAGLHVNCLNEVGDNEVYVCTKVDRVQLSPQFKGLDTVREQASQTKSWVVYSILHSSSEKEVTNDIFVFDRSSKDLVVMILGAKFTKVPMTALTKALSRVNAAAGGERSVNITTTTKAVPTPQALKTKTVSLVQTAPPIIVESVSMSPTTDLDADLRGLLQTVTEVPLDMLKNEATFEELGIDSLMVTELLTELRKAFDVDIPSSDFQNVSDIKSLSQYLRLRGCGTSGATTPGSSTDSDISSSTSVSSVAVLAPSENDVSQLAKIVAENLDITTELTRETNLAEQGLDSLCSIELGNDIRSAFGVDVNMTLLSGDSTFGDLIDMVMPQKASTTVIVPKEAAITVSITPKDATVTSNGPVPLIGAQQAFEKVRYDYDVYTKQTGFFDFWKKTFPAQSRLVSAYIVEAFTALGCPLATLKANEPLPAVQYLPKHSKVMAQYYGVLLSESLVSADGAGYVRSQKPVDQTSSSELYENILRAYPQHVSEHKLLHSTGSKLAECLTGTADPIQILFGNKESRDLLTDVYTSAPMFDAITRLLGAFLGQAFANAPRGETYHILELGGGTGGTTAYIIDYLTRLGVPFTLTFTDISASLVGAARKRFAGRDYMKFMTLDIEKAPPEQFTGYFHSVISSNCIHATRNLVATTTNIRKMLRPDGFLGLVELTKNIPWFDLVFGLLEGWWLFDDGRKHALANEWLWDSNLRTAGFKHVSWSDGESEEAKGLKVITAFAAEAESAGLKPRKPATAGAAAMETVVFKQVGPTSLYADIYFPADTAAPALPRKRKIALMIHGGGHVMLSRKDIRPKQTQLLLARGYLPVSIDYRLCPETNLIDGPMADVCDALRWARHELPSMDLGRRAAGLQIDSDKIAVVGWSTGGHLAMTLAWTSVLQGLQPPDAILAFYCPTDYEDPCWQAPNIPEGSSSGTIEQDYDLLEAVRDVPITGYNVPPPSTSTGGKSSALAIGGWLSLIDPRSRIALHMNWKAQALPVLLHGLPPKRRAAPGQNYHALPQPAAERIVAASPRAQIIRGVYRTPTCLVHGTKDDLIPWRQSEGTAQALRERGVDARCEVVDGAVHLFDLYRGGDVDGRGSGAEAVRRGYEFLFERV